MSLGNVASQPRRISLIAVGVAGVVACVVLATGRARRERQQEQERDVIEARARATEEQAKLQQMCRERGISCERPPECKCALRSPPLSDKQKVVRSVVER
jgi:hypothetical protein